MVKEKRFSQFIPECGVASKQDASSKSSQASDGLRS